MMRAPFLSDASASIPLGSVLALPSISVPLSYLYTSFASLPGTAFVVKAPPLYAELAKELGLPLIGSTRILYRWVVSTPQIEQMQVTFEPMGSSSFYSTNNLPGRTVQKGKVYHTFLNWDGTNLKITNRAGTAY